MIGRIHIDGCRRILSVVYFLVISYHLQKIQTLFELSGNDLGGVVDGQGKLQMSTPPTIGHHRVR